MQINEHILKLSGSASIQEGLELGADYEFTGTGNVVKITDSDNQDGTINRTYTLKPIIASVGDEIIKDKNDLESYNF